MMAVTAIIAGMTVTAAVVAMPIAAMVVTIAMVIDVAWRGGRAVARIGHEGGSNDHRRRSDNDGRGPMVVMMSQRDAETDTGASLGRRGESRNCHCTNEE